MSPAAPRAARGVPGAAAAARRAAPVTRRAALLARSAVRSVLRSVACVLAAGLLAACGRAPVAPPPDIVLVVCDALRADHLDLYGASRATSPQLSAWAREALVFESATTASNWTRPSMHALFTGRTPAPDRVFGQDERDPEHEPVLPELLRAAGYDTIAVSANPFLSAALGTDRGFDSFAELGWSSRAHTGHWKRELAGEAVVDKVAALLAGRPAGGRPLFLYVHFMDTHVPYDPPAEDRADCAPGYGGAFDGSAEPYVALRGLHVDEHLAPADKAQVIALYDGEIRHLDRNLARLRELLDGTLRDRPRVTVVTADHGEAFGEGEEGAYLHGVGMTDALLHVPLIVHGAGTTGRVAERVGLVDLMPTLLARAGVPVPEDIDGVNLLSPRGESLARAGRTFISYRALPRPPPSGAGDVSGVQPGAGEAALPGAALQHKGEAFGELAFSRDGTRAVRRGAEIPAPFADAAARWLATGARRAAAHVGAQPVPAALPPDAREQLEALGYVGAPRDH